MYLLYFSVNNHTKCPQGQLKCYCNVGTVVFELQSDDEDSALRDNFYLYYRTSFTSQQDRFAHQHLCEGNQEKPGNSGPLCHARPQSRRWNINHI